MNRPTVDAIGSAWNDDRKTSMKASLDSDRRDVRDLWNDALLAYRKIAGRELRPEFNKASAINVDAMIAYGIGQKKDFVDWRHDGGKWDKLSTLFIQNMKFIEAGTAQLVNAAVPAFPPAAVIGTAISYIFQACKSVSDDYDVIVVFFEDMKGFLGRVQILERRLPKSRAYQNCLIEVFTCFLTMCGHATNYMKKGRFKKWIINAVHGQDDELAASRTAMDQSLTHLQNASEFAILGNTEDIISMVADVQRNQKEFEEATSHHSDMLGGLRRDQAETLAAVQKLMAFMQNERKPVSTITGPVVRQQGRIRSAFPDIPGNAIQMQIIRDVHVEGTCEWLWQTSNWKTWIGSNASDAPVLLLIGKPGVGKSHLAVTAYDQLRAIAEQDSGRFTCTAYVFCRDNTDSMKRINSIVISTILQISDQNTALREQLNSALNKDGDHVSGEEWDDFFRRLIMPMFEEKSRYQLNLVIDAVNELTTIDIKRLGSLLERIQTQRLRIKVLVTNRPVHDARLRTLSDQEIEGLRIEVTKAEVLPDLKTVLQNRIHSRDSAFQGLARLSDDFKARICDAIELQADNILYADHMLRHLSTIGRPGAIDKALQTLPHDMDALLLRLEYFTRRRIPTDLRPTVKFLLAWMAFAFDPLTLDDANCLIQMRSEGSKLLVEEDIQEFLSRFLRIGATLHDESVSAVTVDATDVQSGSSGSASAYNDGLLEVVFRERAMREYFRRATKDETSMRVHEPLAHKEMFICCSQIIASRQRNQSGGLLEYAVKYILRHWMCIEGAQHQDLAVLSDTDKLLVSETFWNLVSNRNFLAAALENSGLNLDITQMFAFDTFIDPRLFYDGFLNVWGRWSRMLKQSSLLDQLDARVSQYWTQNQNDALLPLLQAHIENWLSAPDSVAANGACNYAQGMLKKTSLSTVLLPRGLVVDWSKGKINGEDILALRDVFHKNLNSIAFCATAEVLNACGATALAKGEVQKAIEMSEDSTQQARNYVCLADIGLSELNAVDEKTTQKEIALQVQDNINHALQWRSVMSPALIPHALRIRSSAESKAGLTTATLKTCDEIRSIEEFVPPDVLTTEFEQYLAPQDWTGMMEMFARWTYIERLTWIVDQSKYTHQQIHEHLLRAAIFSNRVEDLIKFYSEVIEKLDAKDCGAVWRPYLALTYWRALGDTKSAEEILEKVLDSSCNGQEFVLSGKDAGIIAMQAVNMLCDILYQQFRASSDVEFKHKLLERVKTFPEREMVRSLQIGTTSTVSHLLVLARMTQKVGDPRDFEKTLRKAFEICWQNLHDTLVWNDPTNIRNLAKALGLMGLKSEAETLLSCQLYYFDNVVQTEQPQHDQKDNEDADIAKNPDFKETFYADVVYNQIKKVPVKKNPEIVLSDWEERVQAERKLIKEMEEMREREDQKELMRRKMQEWVRDMERRDQETQKQYSYYKWVSEAEGWSTELKDSIFPKCQGPDCDTQWDYWKSDRLNSMSVCMFCTNSMLCLECRRTKHVKNGNDKPGNTQVHNYCCQGNQFYNSPVAGWKGIKNGKILSDDGSVTTTELLDQVKMCWEEAWQEYWSG